MSEVEMQGSPKQASWATDIRTGVLADLAPLPEEVREETARLLDQRREAKWWIDRERVSASEWVDMLGVDQPALLVHPLKEGEEKRAARIEAIMDDAREIRRILDEAGIERTAYSLRIGTGQDRLQLHGESPASGPQEVRAWRDDVGQRIVDALTEAGWDFGSAGGMVLLGNLATGQPVRPRRVG